MENGLIHRFPLYSTKMKHNIFLNKNRKKRIFLFSLLTFFSFGITSMPTILPVNSTSLVIRNSPKEVIDQVWQIVYRDYLDSSGNYKEQDWLSLRKQVLSRKYIDKSDSYEAIRSMLLSLKDPYTRFMDPKEFKEMKIDTTGELTGVGIQLSLDKLTNEVIVVSPIEGSPAYKAGVLPKDVIVSIDTKSTKNMTIEEVVRLIRGKKGTVVTLGLRRKGNIFTYRLIRDRIEIHVVSTKINSIRNDFNIGYIRLRQFNANASKEMRQAILNLEDKKVLGYILDLRSNPGGLLESSVDIARQWLDKGVIVSTQTKDGIKDIRRANGRALTKKPVVVIVNEGSASASEILSGAIQDNNRGLLVGSTTFGKGLVQSVRSLSDGSGVTVTIAKYLTPNGTNIHENGIIPDVVYKLSDDDLLKFTIDHIGTSKDKQYLLAEEILIKSINNKTKNKTSNYFGFNIKYALNHLIYPA